ncbi:glycoside hydrolase family 47 protein [Infundibulicybe gibba]|nr:glycoside hydrolase family 47 protein [Infundibulicybe gibba]
MAEPRLRKRNTKNSKTEGQEYDANQDLPEPGTESDFDFDFTFRNFKYILIPVLVTVSIFFYLNPDILRNLFDSWIGYQEPQHVKYEEYSTPADVAKRDAVVHAFKHAWLAYERDAMGDDEYHPLSQKGSNLTDAGGIGYMVVDSIDTMQLMGLQSEYLRARSWVANKLSFDRDDAFSVFETTIRVLGGLLSAYHLSSYDPIYLEKATELADRMLPAFDTDSGLPHPLINLSQQKGLHTKDLPGLVSTSEAATLQLELRYLSILTKDQKYWEKAEQVMRVIKSARLPHALASVYMHMDEGQYMTSTISLGSRGDSYYEYLLKQYLQTNSSEDGYREMYDDAMTAIHTHLIRKSKTSRLTYTSELVPERLQTGQLSWRLSPKQDHLVCFLAGSLMLGATTTGALSRPVSIPPRPEELSESGNRDWKTGEELLKTCVATHDTNTGLSPEIVHFRIPSDKLDNSLIPTDWYIKGARPGETPPYDARYMLRPETIESLFIAYRLTGDEQYRDQGWSIFKAIEKYCRMDSGGYATVLNVDNISVGHDDKMETFFLSETLKYLFLLFSDSSVLPLDKYVFNTEAHPLPIFHPKIRTSFHK